MFVLFGYPQNIQIRIMHTFCYAYRIVADTWICGYRYIADVAAIYLTPTYPSG